MIRPKKSWERVRHKQLHSKGHGWEASSWAQKGLVDVGDKWLCSNGHGWVGDR